MKLKNICIAVVALALAAGMTAFERNFSTDSTDSFASDDTDCDADSCDSSEEDF